MRPGGIGNEFCEEQNKPLSWTSNTLNKPRENSLEGFCKTSSPSPDCRIDRGSLGIEPKRGWLSSTNIVPVDLINYLVGGLERLPDLM
jgi:hypothetical protein